MNNRYDPRAKFLIALCISTIGVMSDSLIISFVNFVVSILYCIWFKVDLLRLIKKLRRLLYVFIGLIFIQSIFTNGGEPLIKIGDFVLITDYGMKLGVNYLFRVLIVLMSGAIISTSNMRDTIQGITQLGLPYEIGFMTALGIRFLPLLMDEVKNTYTSMELRGINIKKLRLRKRIEIIGRLFVPVIYSTLIRAKELSESAQSRGFIVGSKRTSYRHLKFKRHDYMISLVAIIISTMLITGLVG